MQIGILENMFVIFKNQNYLQKFHKIFYEFKITIKSYFNVLQQKVYNLNSFLNNILSLLHKIHFISHLKFSLKRTDFILSYLHKIYDITWDSTFFPLDFFKIRFY